jgi:hypothetical protein
MAPPSDDASTPDIGGAIQQQTGTGGPPPPVAPCPQDKAWVEFLLLDMEGNPVSGQSYIVGLPDGSTRQGTLDRTGKVRFDGIPPGTCTISYTDLDKDAWEPV